MEQIQPYQIVGGGGGGSGAQVETKFISLNGASNTSDQTTAAFGFVIGQVMIEVTGASDDATNVYAVLWVNMRSFSGSKTGDVTNRIARGISGTAVCHCNVDRTTSGTVLVISAIDEGTDFRSDGTSVISLLVRDWPNPGRIRITAWEDTQS
jgi:hypothetical protein